MQKTASRPKPPTSLVRIFGVESTMTLMRTQPGNPWLGDVYRALSRSDPLAHSDSKRGAPHRPRARRPSRDQCSIGCVYFWPWLAAGWPASDQLQLNVLREPGRAPGLRSGVAAGLHSYLQKSLSPLGRWSPSMASRCTTLLWITRRHRVCREGTVERGRSKAN